MNVADKTEFSRRVERARRAAGYTQESLCQAMGVSKNTVARWESTSAVPRSTRLAELGAILEVDPMWLLHGDRADAPAAPETWTPPPEYAAFLKTPIALAPTTTDEEREAVRWASMTAPRNRVMSVAYLEAVLALMQGILSEGAFTASVALNERIDAGG